MNRVFLTGGTGFLGARVLEALEKRGISTVALDRSARLNGRVRGKGSVVRIVSGDLLEPESYRDALASADVVVHLAALTGRGTAAEHLRVNAIATEILVEECLRAGVRRILFVSTIAVKFPDKRRYHYALAKARAETAVRRSGLRFTILRPTIIVGQGSPVLAALAKLADLPFIPVFGDGRARVQPIYVDDLSDFIVTVVEHDCFNGDTLELGGPASLTIEDLLHAVRAVRRGGRRARSLHVPLGMIVPPLEAAESLGLSGLLPVTVGQLSSFRFDGTADSNPLYESRRAGLRGLHEMLSSSLAPR